MVLGTSNVIAIIFVLGLLGTFLLFAWWVPGPVLTLITLAVPSPPPQCFA
jgi:hypothetical protein